MPRMRVSIEEIVAIVKGVISVIQTEGGLALTLRFYVIESGDGNYTTEDGLELYMLE